MRLHTDMLDRRDVLDALSRARSAGKVTWSVDFTTLDSRGSRKRDHAFEVRLDAAEGDGHRRTNSGNRGAGEYFAATYDEWGWFIAALFVMDPDAIFGPYDGLESFLKQTKGEYQYE